MKSDVNTLFSLFFIIGTRWLALCRILCDEKKIRQKTMKSTRKGQKYQMENASFMENRY